MSVWYVRDNSTFNSNNIQTLVVGNTGWSGVTAWSAGATITAGALRRQSAGNAVFVGSQSTTTLTVASVTSGAIYLGMHVRTTGSQTEFITAFGTGTGGTGTYTAGTSQTIAASTTFTGGLFSTSPRVFVATVGGTTGSAQPNWSGQSNVSKGSQVTDNTVTWIECTSQPAVNGDITNTPASSTVRSSNPGRGKIIKDNSATHIFIQSSAAGTTGSGEPTYVTTSVGSTTTDGTVTWTYIGTSFSNWGAPHAFAVNAFTSTWGAAGDTFYFGDDHSESKSSGVTTSIATPGSSAAPCFVYSIDHTLSLPVSSSGLKAGATITEVQGLDIVTNYEYWYGMTLASTSTILVGGASSNAAAKLDTCKLIITNSGGNSIRYATLGIIEAVNTTVQFASTSQNFLISQGGRFVWRNTATAIAGATLPTTLFGPTLSGTLICEGVDFSALGSGHTIVPTGTAGNVSGAFFTFIDCKFGSSVTFANTPSGRDGPFVDFIRCSSDTKTYIQRRYWYVGTLQEETTVIRTGGASDGTTGISWNIATTANSLWYNPFESFPIAIWNGVTASNRTITLHGIWNSASLPNNDDVWIDVAYLGDSGSPLASFGTETKSNNLASGSALTADSSSAWDSLVSARQNSHAYSLGNVIATASNAGRIFFCTTAGTTAGSEPGGYAGAADGGSVTDSGAVFRAGTRFLLTVTLSAPQPQLVGYLRATVKTAKVSSTFYVDPLIVLS